MYCNKYHEVRKVISRGINTVAVRQLEEIDLYGCK